MKKIALYADTTIYQFDELVPYITNVIVIERGHTAYVFDTFCGSEYMQCILEDLCGKEIQVIFSHHDFDHVFGAAAFEDCKIIAHQKCCEWLKQYGQKQLKDQKQWLKGKEVNVLPNCTFEDEYVLCDTLKLVYTPGHTEDCITLIDLLHGCAYVGDNVEEPICEMTLHNPQVYLKTIEFYQSLKMRLIGAHTTYIGEELLQKHHDYFYQMLNEEC